MWTVEDALTRILSQAERLSVERIALLDAPGRSLAEDIVSDMRIPPFDNSAVDGYAVRAEDTAGAGEKTPVLLRTLTDISAGVLPTEAVEPGTAARIMTGAPVPPGANAIVMVEDTRNPKPGTVAILEAAKAGQHVRRAGEDAHAGDLVLQAGTRIRSAEVALLAAMGRAQVAVFRPPNVAVISTGDEIVDIEQGVLPPPGKIRDSNRYALAALAREAGAALHSITHIPDDFDATEAAFRECADAETGADVIVTAGGVSVGDRDFVKPVLEKLGQLDLWKIAMKPGKPLAFGSIGRTLFFGLPGNPVSAMVTFELFVRPALWKMMGRAPLERYSVQATVLENIPHTPGRREYVRAVTTTQNGQFVTRSSGAQGSHMLSSMAQANSLLIIPQDSPGLNAGEMATVLLLE
jgi:molybdopterin molybdotransferase